MLHNPDLDKYITKHVIECLYIMEGYKNGAKETLEPSGAKTWTTYYGITAGALDNIKRLNKDEFNVPEELLNATVKSLTKKQAREVAYYNAAYLTKYLDNQFENKESFSDLDINMRSAILSALWTGGHTKLKKSYDEDAPGSLLRAIETQDRENIARALISNADGSIMKNPNGGKTDGLKNRYYAAIRLMYNPNEMLNDEARKDELYNKWSNEPTSTNIVNCLNTIQRANIGFNTEQKYACDMNSFIGSKEAQDEVFEQNATTDIPKQENTQEDGFLVKFTNALKNLFTNTNQTEQEPAPEFVPYENMVGDDGRKIFEEVNGVRNVERNPNNNMQ